MKHEDLSRESDKLRENVHVGRPVNVTNFEMGVEFGRAFTGGIGRCSTRTIKNERTGLSTFNPKTRRFEAATHVGAPAPCSCGFPWARAACCPVPAGSRASCSLCRGSRCIGPGNPSSAPAPPPRAPCSPISGSPGTHTPTSGARSRLPTNK